MASPPQLDVWLYGTHIATITGENRSGLVRPTLTWTTEGIDRWGSGSRVLSAKLPLGARVVPALVRNYLDGLLPEGNARTNHAMAAGISPDNTLGLIAAYGRDTPGAAIFVEHGHGDPTSAGNYEPLTLSDVAERLRSADKFSPARFGNVIESSTLPGMVPKVTLHREITETDDTWYACKDGAASTWIVKRSAPEDAAAGDVIDTEVACLALARDLGLTTIEAEVISFGEGALRAIAVSRYDRVPGLDGRFEGHGAADPRLHQEDLAQAIGLNTADPNRKFQWGSQMPSLGHAADVLRLDGGDRDHLLRLATFSHLVGNTDMHAKNISFLRLPNGRVSLAPAYDIAMHLHHEREARRFALDVNGKHLVDDVTIDDLSAEGKSWGLPTSRVQKAVEQTVHDLSIALDRIDPALYPGVTDQAWSRVRDRVTRATEAGRPPARRIHAALTTPSGAAIENPKLRKTPDGRYGPRPPT